MPDMQKQITPKKGTSKSQKKASLSDAPGDRIAKYLARVGVGSRRDVERMIEEGRVKVNGKTLTSPAFKVTGKEKILVNDEPIAEKDIPRMWRYHKPDGLVTSHKDEQGRRTMFEALPTNMPRVISVGRLDLTSEGLILLTNDGELARALELPSTGWSRRYRARAYGKVTQEQLDTLRKGVVIDGIPTGEIIATLDRQQGDNAWINVTLHDGKNREIRRALETLKLQVNRLIRVSYGPYMLGDLGKGACEEIKTRVLRDQIGHLIDIPEEKTVTRKPKRGSFASAKRFQDKPAETKGANAPKGRGKFAKKTTEKPKSKTARPPKKVMGKAYGKPGGKTSGKFAPRGHGKGKK
ncbi:23S rRNA pseudouridine2605 synthase [Litorimonas taeanensis]|uniref:Pseudouridine synthase n=1 Tax=Litorimonas taeanensis TaxID=568099 RepID=A0A420WM99_9PROT|nr:pseudouridine synthase [Litorimonas taeanensis]RKQ72026.1 23S rRNA pseudouridine2605 synthase [Litorimonas taeanensis]